ncbi:MAG TPA: class I mannose-6-phosphate isomerase [Anaerolineales bacterium]|nr:class I mannose-6-phosphate isomerase [Anaerolineales bacterium]
MSLEGLRLAPQYHTRVWGGARLQQAAQPIGEAWVIFEDDLIADGPNAGRSLGALAAAEGAALLGTRPLRRTGLRMPLLIKLLDCRDWLSVQVHPNDAQAIELEGPGQFGKTEAWHILEADPGSEIIVGLRHGVSADALAQAVRGAADGARPGRQGLLPLMQSVPAAAGDTFFIGAGTLHALGPGLLLYEVQQTSDITYRVWDWDRPTQAGRALHVEKSLAVIDHTLTGAAAPIAPEVEPGVRVLTRCDYFELQRLNPAGRALPLDTRGESFQALTCIAGKVTVAGSGWSLDLVGLESALVPAAVGGFTVAGTGEALRAFVP